MTDRELLELAARAAGIAIKPCTCNQEKWPFQYAEANGARRGHWNPLQDDGDALRLAVKLRMIIRCYVGSIIVDGCGQEWFEEHDMSDRHAATRRAIVRAAAAIGEEMNYVSK